MQSAEIPLHSDAASGPTRSNAPRWLAAIDDVVLKLVVILTSVFFLCVVVQVFMRYVLEQPMPWSEEVARYSFIWASFLTAAVIVGRREHFGIEFLIEALSPRPRYIMQLISTVLCFGFTIVLIVFGAQWSWRLLISTSPVLEIPQGLVYAIVPITGFYMAVHLAVQAFQLTKKLRDAGTAS